MSDYSKMKNAELEALLKERNLPHGGRKADMITRLQDADKAKSTAAPAEEPKSEAPAVEAAPVTEEAQPDAAIETVPAPAATEAPSTDAKTDGDKAAVEGQAKSAPSFSANLASTALDEEIARRKKRAEKFGTSTEDTDAIRNLERQKRFGTGPEAAKVESDNVGVNRLDEALPERKKRGEKRSHDAVLEESYDDPGLRKRGGFRGGRRGRGRGGRPGGGRTEGRSEGGAPSWMSEADKAAAEKRKAKFG